MRVRVSIGWTLLAGSMIAGPAFAADAAAGKAVFKAQCALCHSAEPGDNGGAQGPTLDGVIGRKAGSVAGYSYSSANKNSGITWDEATFREYIKDPKAKIPGTKMTFAGIKSETEANNLWAYLSSFDKDGKQKQ